VIPARSGRSATGAAVESGVARTMGVAWLCGGLLVDAMPAPPSCVQDAEINHVESSQFGICVWSEDCKYT
jgi:hypothetical protein